MFNVSEAGVRAASVFRAGMIASTIGALSACGGGSSGGVASTPSPPSFTSFSSVAPGTTATVNGSTREGSYTSTNSGNTVLVNSVSGVTTGSGSVQFSTDASRLSTGLKLTGSQSSVSFQPGDGSTGVNLANMGLPGANLQISANNQNLAIYASPYTLGYDYQSFGVWATGLGTGSGKIGAISVGAATSGGSVPTSGTATFNGYAGGIVAMQGQPGYEALASAHFVADFQARSLAISTTNSMIYDVATGQSGLAGNLNFSGTLNYAAGSNNLTGTLATSSALGLSGPSSAQFFGPQATEVGGTFYLTNATNSIWYIGAFGGK
ncbi:MAG: transferrin-binding protein-like solute binding protein [Sphingomonadales bacterium]|nr:transferrin-binding protein-like solute binding protein [Sphingomonadales bacterium]